MNMLRNKLSSFLTKEQPSSSSTQRESVSIIQKNNEIIGNICIEDLNYVEQDLVFYEKVSLVFLLYGHELPMVGLQKLRILLRITNKISDTNLLWDWARYMESIKLEWQQVFLEALCIANINHVILKLGLNLEDLRERFFPSNPETNLFIHPILKCLYMLSEILTDIDSVKLINFINDNYLQDGIKEFLESDFIEIHILDWIDKSVIVIGDWNFRKPNVNIKNSCDITAINFFLSQNNISNDFCKSLTNISIRLNFTKNNVVVYDNNKNQKLKPDAMEESSLCNHENKLRMEKIAIQKTRNCYKISKKSIGYVLIINQKKFEKSTNNLLGDRIGTDNDMKRIKSTFSKYGYIPIIKNNLKRNEIINCITNAVTNSKDKDSLIVCILSHGLLGTIYSSDNIQIEINYIKHLMVSDELTRKPKMLIIQACQQPQTQEQEIIKMNYSKNKVNDQFFDMVTGHSTIPGTLSYRHTIDGSWYIQTLCDMIEEYGDNHEITEIFTLLNSEFIDKIGPGGEKMVPEYISSLTKRFFLKEQS